MAWIDVNCYFRPKKGTAVTEGEIVFVGIKVTNNLPWPLTDIRYELANVTGNARLEPETDHVPKQVVGQEITPNGNTCQEFTLKGASQGNAAAEMRLIWKLAGTDLTFDVGCSTSFTIHPE